MKITEGYMPFKDYETYYRIAGECSEGKKPLVLMHGGPGSTHNYFEVLDKVAETTGHALVSYDQIGCGNSYLDGHPELWTLETWTEELEALREHLSLDECHILGQSWGGMLAISYLIDQKPKGIKSAILSSTLPGNKIWVKEQHRMISQMNPDEQEAIAKAEATGDFSSPEYVKANARYMLLHCAGEVTEDSPECLRRPKKAGSEAYLYGWGPNEYNPTGSLRDYEYTHRLDEIDVPCLIMSGTDDLCTPVVAKTMFDGIRQSKWELFPGCRHMPFVEDNDHYCRVLGEWLDEND